MFIKVQPLPIMLVLFALFWGTLQSSNNYRPPDHTHILCDGNRLKHIPTLGLDKHNDINELIKFKNGKYKVNKVVHKDQNLQTYTLSLRNISVSYQKQTQTQTVVGTDAVIIKGGRMKVDYAFDWQKQHLDTLTKGQGKGSVKTDSIEFVKRLSINTTYNYLQWEVAGAMPITMKDNLTISEVSPQSIDDSKILDGMLNGFTPGGTSMKTNLVYALGNYFSYDLNNVLSWSRDVWKQLNWIDYSFTGLNDPITLRYDNVIRKATISKRDGFEILLSQSIRDYRFFQCGIKQVPFAKYMQKYEGLQQYISNSFLKSTLQFNLNKSNIEIKVSAQNWQSQSFQFTMGNLLQIFPSTKRIPAAQPIIGYCLGLNDTYFKLGKKTTTSYSVSINYTCQFFILNNTKKLFAMNLPVDYQIQVRPLPRSVNFIIKQITAVPTFIQEIEFPMRRKDLAEQMVSQVLNLTIGSKVFGSGFRTLGGVNPGVLVGETSLLLYGTESDNTPTATSAAYDDPNDKPSPSTNVPPTKTTTPTV